MVMNYATNTLGIRGCDFGENIVVIVVNYNLHEINSDVKIYAEVIFLKQLLSY